MIAGDEDDWRSWSKIGDEVMHIRLREWADILVIAPLSANTMAKLAQVGTILLPESMHSSVSHRSLRLHIWPYS